MKNKVIFSTLLVLVFLFGVIVNLNTVSAYSDSITLEDYVIHYEYQDSNAGSYFNLKVTLTNYGDSKENLTLKIDDNDPFEVKGSKTWKVELNASANASKTFVLFIDEDAESKKYDLDFNLDEGSDDWDDTFGIKVLSDSAELELGEIVSSPKKILPGAEDVALTINLKNSGENDVENLIAKLNLPDGFHPSSSYSTIVHAGDLENGKTTPLIFYFNVDENLPQNNYLAELELNYENDGSDETTKLEVELPTFAIPQFEISKIQILSEDILPGKTAKVKISVKNIGGKDAKDVSLKVYQRSDQPFEFSEKSSYIGTLNQGDTGYATFEFDVDKDATPSKYLLDFQVRSVDGEDVVVDDVTANIEVSKKEFNLANYIWYILAGIVGLILVLRYIKRRK